MKLKDIQDKASNRHYHFLKMDQDNGNLHLYDENVHYVETANLKHGKVTFNGRQYTSIEQLDYLFDDMINFANDKKYIKEYYDPYLYSQLKVELVASDYLKKLGFDYNSSYDFCAHTDYSLKDMYGNITTSIHINWDDKDKESGTVVRTIGDFRWSECKFNNVDEVIGAINSMIEPEILLNIANGLNVIDKLTKDRNYDGIQDAKLVNFEKYVEQSKEKVRKALKQALDNLDK